MPGLNSCDRVGHCEFSAGHAPPCSHQIVEVGGTEFTMMAWSSGDPNRKAEERAMEDDGWKRFTACVQFGGTMVVFERPKR